MTSTDRDELAMAIHVVAAAVLRTGLERVEWDDYPDIGEHDWARVVEHADYLARTQAPALLLPRALQYLERRAAQQ